MISAPSLPDLAAAIRSREPRGATRITAIDGPAGAGKSTLAAALATELRASVVHTDYFASWENPVDWWPEFLARVLEPLARGDHARFDPTTWGGPPHDPVDVAPGGDVIVEGVTASRAAFRPFLAYAIWVDAPRELCLQRGLARGGHNTLERWDDWQAAEHAYVEREQPVSHVDVVVRGH
jgi:uridine kinase